MRTLFNAKKLLHFTLVVSVFAAAFIATLHAASWVEGSATARSVIEGSSYFGVLIVAIISGLNPFIPVPAATFVPVFIAGGLSMYLIVATLVAGTLIADLVGFYLGRFGSSFVTKHYPATYEHIKNLHEHHTKWLPFFVFFYAAFVPFPNEAYLIPLGIIGVHLRRFIVPIILGTIVHQTLAAYGAENVFRYFF